MEGGLQQPENRLEWVGRPAFFELASGLVFVGMSAADIRPLLRDLSEARVSESAKGKLSRLAHEVTHYFQFLGCGYVAWIGSRVFHAVRQNSPFPFTDASLEAWLAKAKPRPSAFDEVASDLARTGQSGLSPRALIEGAAFLAQAKHDNPGLTNGGYLILLERERHGEFYGQFYRHLSLLFGARAMRETLFLAQVALEFITPHLAIDRLIEARVRSVAQDNEDFSLVRRKLVDAVGCEDHIGSAADLMRSGLVHHPLFNGPTVYADEANREEAVRQALWGERPMLHDFLCEGEFLVNDAVWWVGKEEDSARRSEREEELWVRTVIARLSLQFGTPLDGSDV
jgi:hypothetical protein